MTNQTQTVICQWSSICIIAPECDHGSPHIVNSHCKDADVCYDIQPPRRAWCVPVTTKETIRECCGQQPTVFELRPGDWAVHCRHCWDGVGPCQTRQDAIAEWNAMQGS